MQGQNLDDLIIQKKKYMEALYMRSRSIIQNIVYEKFQNSRFSNYKRQLQKLRHTSGFDIHREDSPNYLQNISKYKNAHKSIQRIFDDHRIENKSLYKRLVDIQTSKKARQDSDTLKLRGTINQERNWQLRKQAQKRKINDQNEIIKRRINQQRKNGLTISKLRKQYNEHDKLVHHIRKIRS